MNPEEMRDRLKDMVREVVREEMGGQGNFLYGTYVSPGATPGRHNISILDEDFSNVPALIGVGTIQPGDTVVCIRSRAMPLTIIGRFGVESPRLIAYKTDSTDSQQSSSITIITIANVPLSADRVYLLRGSTRARATNSDDFGGIINSAVNVNGTPRARDRALLRASTSTNATVYMKPDGIYEPPTDGLYTVTLTGGTGNGVANPVDWRGAGGDSFFHWLAVFDAGRAGSYITS